MNEKKATDMDEAVARRNKMKTEAYDWLTCIVSALLCCVLLYVFAVRIIGVDGHSMNPTLLDGDRLIVSNLFYTPKAGDVIIFRKENFRQEPLVKRVIATEGQVVDIDFEIGAVKVDGKVLNEDYINDLTYDRLNFVGPVTVPKGHVFAMGDNRNHSADSRDDRIGFIDERYILGRAYFIFLPLKNIRSL